MIFWVEVNWQDPRVLHGVVLSGRMNFELFATKQLSEAVGDVYRGRGEQEGCQRSCWQGQQGNDLNRVGRELVVRVNGGETL